MSSEMSEMNILSLGKFCLGDVYFEFCLKSEMFFSFIAICYDLKEKSDFCTTTINHSF